METLVLVLVVAAMLQLLAVSAPLPATPSFPSTSTKWDETSSSGDRMRRLVETRWRINQTRRLNTDLGDGDSNGTVLTPTATPNFDCFEAEGLGDGVSHMCQDLRGEIVLGPSLPPFVPFLLCKTGNVTNGDRAKCSSLCLLYEPTLSESCTSCALLQDGEIAYDCRNLVPDVECPARDWEGTCQDYVHWECYTERGDGNFCRIDNGASNPAFQYDNVPGSQLYLYCADDISGLDVSQCREPFCTIILPRNGDIRNGCKSCKVLLENTSSTVQFSYDCASTVENLTCPILTSDGTCLQRVHGYRNAPVGSNVTFSNVYSYMNKNSNAGGTSKTSNIWGWTLKSIDPTVFNVMSDLFHVGTATLVGFVIGVWYPQIMSWQIQVGRSIPIKVLSKVPKGVVDVMKLFRILQWSVPVAALAFFVVIGKFSQVIADSGLDFVQLSKQGPRSTVLVVDVTKRNPNRPMQLAGDPRIARTSLALKSGGNDARAQSALLDNFMLAVELIARGGSPFVIWNAAQSTLADTTFGGLAGSNSFFVANDELPLVEMNLEMPVDCASVDMATFVQGNEGAFFEAPIEVFASVPNCTFASPRGSGIYGENSKSAIILETLDIAPIIADIQGGIDIRLINGSQSFYKFMTSPTSKRLARDRDDWRKGRVFTDINGIRVGNVTIRFASVVLATGAESGSRGVDQTATTEYALVGEVNGKCPERPSELPSNGTECLATITLNCDSFQEDVASMYHPIYAPQEELSFCELHRFSFVWGRNFVADQELAAVVAGLHGIVRPSLWNGGFRTFDRHAVLASLFALATVEERPSVEIVVRPRLEITYVVFMLLPIFLSLCLWIFLRFEKEKGSHPVPSHPLDFMILGSEAKDLVPVRQTKRDEFPSEKDQSFVYGAFLDAALHPGYGISKFSDDGQTTTRKKSTSPSSQSSSNQEDEEDEVASA